MGDLDAGLAACARALAEHERLPMLLERGRTLLVLGSTQRRARRRGAARDSLQRALSLFEGAGAAVWADRARAELGRIGGRTASRDELTPAEQRVAALVATGRTNKEVAAELVVTVRTVESSLTRIYAKLGVRSRAELAHRLAAWADERAAGA